MSTSMSMTSKSSSSSSKSSSSSSYSKTTSMSAKTVVQSSSSSSSSSIRGDGSALSALGGAGPGGALSQSMLTWGDDCRAVSIMQKFDQEFADMKRELLGGGDGSPRRLLALDRLGSGSELIKLDVDALMAFADDDHKDRLKLNFDVREYQSESVTVKADNDKIEIRGKRRAQVGEEETSEEYCKTYELPQKVDPKSVTSSFYKGGVLTVELPAPAPAAQ